MNEKRVRIEMPGSGKSTEVEVAPTTTVADVLENLGLDAQAFAVTSPDSSRLLGRSEKLFRKVETGAKLLASPLMQVGG